MNDSLKILRVWVDEEEMKATPPTRLRRRSFWCWLRRHRILVGGYNYDFANMSMTPVMVCQCKLNKVNIPNLTKQMRRQK